MRSKSTKIISVLIALALSLNGGLPVIAEALSTGMEEIQDQVSEYVDDEVNQEGSEISEAVKVLFELVADLPEVSFITEENKEAILLDFEAVTIAYELLSEEDKVIFELTSQYTKLMAIQAMLFGTQLIPEQLDLLQRGEWNQAELSLDEQLEYIQLVQRLSEESGVMMMGLDDTDLPFQIGTAVQLADLAEKVNAGNENFNAKSCILANDIDLAAYQSGTGWTPIGTASNPFKGTFDGGGKVVTGLEIKNSATDFQGLFGWIETDGTVKNLGVVECSIKGFMYVGGVAGHNNGKIENCYTTGSVSGSNSVGGVAGNNSGKIENCYTTGSVSDSVSVGGVAGHNNGTIENCYTTGSISGSDSVGGVVGLNGFDARIGNCYTTGSISGSDFVGGVVGQNSGKIENCAALNPSISGNSNVGRVVGQHGGITLTGNYAWSGMSVNVAGSDKPLDKGLVKVDGEDVIAIAGKLMKTDDSAFNWTSDLGFSEDIWDIPTGTYKLPKLHGSNASYPDMPGGMAQEVIITQGKTEFIYAQGGVDITTAFNVLPAGVDVEYTTSTEGVSLNGSMLLLTVGQTGNTIVSLTATVDANPYHSAATLTTNITVSKNSDGGGGNLTPKPNPDKPIMGNVVVKPTIDKDGNASITIKDKEIASAIKKALKDANENGIDVTITLENSKKINSYTVALPKSVIEQLINAKVNFLTINGGANITFDLVALSHINITASNNVTVTATKRITNSLSSEAQVATDGRPVYDFKVTSDDKNINTFGNGKLLLTIPYETQRVDASGKVSKTGRFEQSSNLIGVYLDEQGKLHELLDSYYDNTSKKLIMHTDHLSTYGVAYKNTSSNLTDITNHWAKEEINFVVARGLLTGTNNQFLPDALISRGEFVAALAKLANADLSIYKTASFTDCPSNNPYFGAVEWATQYKLIDGAGNGLFAPSSPISRQTMALVLSNYARVMGYKLPSAQKEITFLDQTLISSWARSSVKDLQMAGIVMSKKNGNFDPLTSATRAETAMMLSRFIQANTSDGWKMNDCGEWMYFKNGQYLTGSRSIDGLTYKFDQYGVTESLPKEKRYVLYIVQNGDTLRTLSKKHELSVTELATFNQLKTSDVLLVGDEIRIPKK